MECFLDGIGQYVRLGPPLICGSFRAAILMTGLPEPPVQRRAGFTVLEVTLVLALLTLLAGGILTTISMTQRAFAESENRLDIRKSAVYALAAGADRNSVSLLLELLEDPDLRDPAAKELRRISGSRERRTVAQWHRWWQQQPEAQKSASTQDPDLAQDHDGSGKAVGDPQKRLQQLLETRGVSLPAQNPK